MQDIIHFLIKYWFLVIPLMIVLVLLILEEARTKGVFRQINTSKATQWINQKNAVVVDIRDKASFKQGHIIGAVNVPKAELERDLGRLSAYNNRPLIIVCATGQQASVVATQLRKQGFEQAVALAGGLSAWQQDLMPITNK